MKNAARFFLICGVVAAGVAAMAEARRYYLCGKCAVAVGKEKTRPCLHVPAAGITAGPIWGKREIRSIYAGNARLR